MFIVTERQKHPRLSKDKLAVLLRKECAAWGIRAPSASTVGRIITDLQMQGRLHKHTKLSYYAQNGSLHESKRRSRIKKKRRSGYTPKQPGDMLQVDTIVKFIHGVKRYILTAVDYHGRFAFGYAYKSPSSANASDFLAKLKAVTPFTIQRVHHDNGSEFHKHFITACEKHNITQLWNYPKRPKHNGMVERLNRSFQDEYVDWNLDTLSLDIEQFNQEFMDWLIWYNTIRPHYALGMKSPIQNHIDLLQLTSTESRMLWTDTCSRF